MFCEFPLIGAAQKTPVFRTEWRRKLHEPAPHNRVAFDRFQSVIRFKSLFEDLLPGAGLATEGGAE
jgi:hypothetical protein